jgi:NADPH-dependent 2,4-dienoyl-CoA reductase/sulfur reductase-like enzyme/rhodanese-related sulfurtransferase/two-component sensor histidine kinase
MVQRCFQELVLPMTNESHKAKHLPFTALAAHQLRSPLDAARSLLRVLTNDLAGPLTHRQRELVAKADARCGQAAESINRIMVIARLLEHGVPTDRMVNLAAIVRRASEHWAEEASRHAVTLTASVEQDRLYVRGEESALAEVLDALLGNAVKYTPEGGRVRLRVDADDDTVRLCVGDSGVGIPEAEREQVLEPFVRSGNARGSARPGTGLGLALVKSVVDALQGHIRIDKSDLGGAEFTVELPTRGQSENAMQGDSGMSNKFKVVVIGGVAAGPKVASKVIRLRPDADVTVVDKGEFLSYAGCGLPYYVSGVVKEQKELMCTGVGVVRDPVFFQKVKNFHALNHTEAVEVDRAKKRVRVRNLTDQGESWLEYDKLVFATGANPVVPPIPGIDLGNIFSLHGVHDAEGIRAVLAEHKSRDVTIVGGGLIGMEVCEALAEHGCRLTIVEMLPQTLRILDPEIARLVEQHIESHAVKVMTGTTVKAFEGNSRVARVVTDKGTFPAEMVILAIGVRPNVELARSAGLTIGTTGAIQVNDHLQTSDPDIYAAGDCVESTNLLTGEPAFVPLGSTANKQGRVAAMNVCGNDDVFPGIVGSTVCKVFDYCVARTGLTETEARKLGYNVVTVLAPAPDKAHFMPESRPLLLKLVVDADNRRLLGAQATGPGEGAKRIDVAAMAITCGMTVDQLANVDLCYAPPYAPAMDNIITAANVARNKLDGHMVGITAAEVKRMQEESQEFVFLDVRSPGEYEQVRLPGATLIPLGALRGRLNDVPRNKPIVAFCKISLRGYEAALILRNAGYEDVRVLDGGIAMWPYEKVS